MKSSFAGMKVMPAGSIQEMDDAEAQRMVSMGHAEYVEVKASPKEPEAAEVKTKFEGRQKRTRKK